MKKPYIIQENDIDGSGMDLKIPVTFSRTLADAEEQELANTLVQHRQTYIDNDECFDTDSVVEEALQDFCPKHDITYEYIHIPIIEF